MEFFNGLDLSIDETAICVVDDKGEVHLQTEAATDPEAILQGSKTIPSEAATRRS